jgi:hypothetical protein
MEDLKTNHLQITDERFFFGESHFKDLLYYPQVQKKATIGINLKKEDPISRFNGITWLAISNTKL